MIVTRHHVVSSPETAMHCLQKWLPNLKPLSWSKPLHFFFVMRCLQGLVLFNQHMIMDGYCWAPQSHSIASKSASCFTWVNKEGSLKQSKLGLQTPMRTKNVDSKVSSMNLKANCCSCTEQDVLYFKDSRSLSMCSVHPSVCNTSHVLITIFNALSAS